MRGNNIKKSCCQAYNEMITQKERAKTRRKGYYGRRGFHANTNV